MEKLQVEIQKVSDVRDDLQKSLKLAATSAERTVIEHRLDKATKNIQVLLHSLFSPRKLWIIFTRYSTRNILFYYRSRFALFPLTLCAALD